jgi:hypothetical protein
LELTLNRLLSWTFGEFGFAYFSCQPPKFLSSRWNFAWVSWSQPNSIALISTLNSAS